MRVDINKITSAVNKVTSMASDLKQKPGVLLDLSENLLKVCFSDSHKSIIEKIEVQTEEGDHFGATVVDYDTLVRAISNCQPSGSIKITDIYFTFKDNNIITVSADQNYEPTDAEGNSLGTRKMSTKKMDLVCKDPGSDMRAAVLSRMDYESIFNASDKDGNPVTADVYDKKEFMDALARTATEKGRQIYFSVKTQSVFVANQAHLTAIPIRGSELTEDDKNSIAGALSEAGPYTQDDLEAAYAKASNKINYSISISQSVAKSIYDVLNRTDADTVSVYTKDRFCNIFIDSEDEHVGIWTEMVQANRAHVGALDRYCGFGYQSYQLLFLREFILDILKSVNASSASEKIALKFEAFSPEDNPEAKCYNLIIDASSSSSSVSDKYSLAIEDVSDTIGDLATKTFVVSTKVLLDMIAQLKTDYVALDFNCENNAVALRMSEIIRDKWMEVVSKSLRSAAATYCAQNNIEFNDTTRTPDIVKAQQLRSDSILGVRQYTIVGN